MPIPNLNHEGLLPPTLHPTGRNRSPYMVSVEEIISRFGTSPQRCEILRGFVEFRHSLFICGFSGLQWIGGSFVEMRMDEVPTPTPIDANLSTAPTEPVFIEHDPGDIDVVSFVNHGMHPEIVHQLTIDHNLVPDYGSKERYSCDSYMIDISSIKNKLFLLEEASYWYSLFSHTRKKIWKGMLRVPLAQSKEEYDTCMELIEGRVSHESN